MKASITTGEATYVTSPPPYPGTPRWVKVFGIIVIVAVLLAVAGMIIGGEHGPGRHGQSGSAGGQAPSSSALEAHALPGGGRG